MMLGSRSLFAQIESPPLDTSRMPTPYVGFKRGMNLDSINANVASGELTPGRGFDLLKTK